MTKIILSMTAPNCPHYRRPCRPPTGLSAVPPTPEQTFSGLEIFAYLKLLLSVLLRNFFGDLCNFILLKICGNLGLLWGIFWEMFEIFNQFVYESFKIIMALNNLSSLIWRTTKDMFPFFIFPQGHVCVCFVFVCLLGCEVFVCLFVCLFVFCAEGRGWSMDHALIKSGVIYSPSPRDLRSNKVFCNLWILWCYISC